jgi:NADP-dependent 3-hydroxy acid dehydrogenase YdfG
MTSVLAGRLVVVLGGSAGIGLATARAARAEGAGVVITGRDSDRLQAAAREIGAQHSAAFDADDTMALADFFATLPTPIDHVLVTAGGPHYGPILAMEPADLGAALSGHMVRATQVARHAAVG